MFLIFPTQEEAQAANDLIVANITNVMRVNFPARLQFGRLVSVDIEGNLRLNATPTTNWDIPRQYQEGWAIAKPEQKDMGEIPIALALEGVGGVEAETVTIIPAPPAEPEATQSES